MYENIQDLINNSKYNEAKELIVEELKNNDNPDLWYLLFLSENNNYLEFDPNNINNTYAYNQATRSNNEEYELEFKLYKELSLMNLNKVFRLIQIGKYDEVDELLKNNNYIDFNLSKMTYLYLKDLIINNDKNKLNYYLKFINYLNNNTIDNRVIELKKQIESYIKDNNLKKEIINNSSDFEIKDNVLIKYRGNDSNIIIPDGITKIEAKAFWMTGVLDSIIKCITIPNTVTSIGGAAFSDCYSLESLSIPDSIKRIGEYALPNRSNLKYNIYNDCLYLGNENNPYVLLVKSVNTDINEIVINENTKVLNYNSFYKCSNIINITIPSNVKSIGHRAFMFCSNLEEINLLEDLEYIEDSAFSRCIKLKNIVIPSTLVRIGDEAFSYCSNLESIVLPDNIKSIGMQTFGHCINLKEIIIPNNIKIIYPYTFLNCKKLESVRLSDNLEEIRSRAFDGCSNLKRIVIPANVKNINVDSFINCNNLEEVVCYNDNYNIVKKAFKNTNIIKI